MDDNSKGIRIIKKIELNFLEPNPMQPRKYMNEERLKILAASFIGNDVDYTVLVSNFSENDKERFVIIDGHRRCLAAKLVGLKSISCQVYPKMSLEEIYEMSVRANSHRDNFTPIEEALAAKTMKERGTSQGDVARIMGRSQGYISSTLKYLKLCPGLQNLLSQGGIGKGIALKLTSYKTEVQEKLFSEFRIILLKESKDKCRSIRPHPDRAQLIFAKLASKMSIKAINHKKVRGGSSKKRVKTVSELLVGKIIVTLKKLDETISDVDGFDADNKTGYLSLQEIEDMTSALEKTQEKVRLALEKLSTFT